ncbi:MAG: S-layer homology domain-containing protein [Prochlorothrix sp.]
MQTHNPQSSDLATGPAVSGPAIPTDQTPRQAVTGSRVARSAVPQRQRPQLHRSPWLRLALTALSGLAFIPSAPALAQPSSFTDIRGHWSQLCVESLAADNIASGFTDARFRPDVPLTRGLYADLLSRAFPNAPQLQPAPEFWDLQPTDPFYEVIRKTAQQGFFSGAQGRFGSADRISRQDFFVALASGLSYTPTSPTDALLRVTYDDADLIAPYARDAVAALTERKFVVSPLGVRDFRPQAPMSRGEAAAVLCQLRGSALPNTGIPTAFVVDPPTHPEPFTERRTAAENNVTAQLTYSKTNYEYGEVRLQILRDNQTIINQPLNLPGGFSRNLSLQLYDLDGDGSVEVVIDGIAGEGRCCSQSWIYSYLPLERTYSVMSFPWGYGSYRLLDWDQDGIPEFHGGDSRFSFRFAENFADVVLPLQIWQYRQGQMFDVTRLYPQLLARQSEMLWQNYLIRKGQGKETKGILAAYGALRFLMNEGEEGFNQVSFAYGERDRSRYLQDLREFLRGTGYTNY